MAEEITRFILDHRALTAEFKKTRHQIDLVFKAWSKNTTLLAARNSLKDIGKDMSLGELKRKNYQDIFCANIQRAKESLRVLEEFSKLKNINVAMKFKRIRYRLYELEKKVIKEISPLCDYR